MDISIKNRNFATNLLYRSYILITQRDLDNKRKMKKYIVLFLMVLCTLGSYAQSSMTDSQVIDYIVQEHQKGTSQTQIVTKLMQKGVDINQIRRVRAMYERMQKGSGLGTVSDSKGSQDRTRKSKMDKDSKNSNLTSEERVQATMGAYNEDMENASRYSSYRLERDHSDDDENTYDEDDEEFLIMKEEMDNWMPGDTAAMYEELLRRYKEEKKKKKVFGRNIFNNKNLSFEPDLNIATPANYRLGAGDAVYVDIYGASQKSVEATVSPDGFIVIDGYGPVKVAGMTVSEANAHLRATLGKRYRSSQIRLSVGETRTIIVNVMGEVKKPGTYTLSPFSTVFNALYLAGGIGELGTLRNIKVYRHNKLISTIDVYNFILNGKANGNVRLADNDVIIVGAYDCLVNISGKVKRPMYYEMKRGESLSTLIHYAGGFTGDAYTKNVRVQRKTGRQYSIYNVNEFDMSSFRLSDEDSISVDSVLTRYENMVEVKGAVFRPGMYQVGGDINSVRSLLEACEGLTEYAFTPHAVMHRMRADRTLEVIPVDVDGIMSGKVADIALQNEDVLFIPTKQDVQEEQTITILGEVQYPGIYKYAHNETLEDFILQAGGLKSTASTVKVDVARRLTNPKAETSDSLIANTYSFALKDGFVIDGQPGFTLKPFDEVYVRKSPGSSEQQHVEVMGEVLFAGTYSLQRTNTRLSDLYALSGGATNLGYIKGARLERKTNEDERKRMQDAYKLAKEQQQENLMQMAAKSQNAGAVTQIAQQTQNTALEKFQVPEYYTVGIELDKALAKPGSNADIVLREGDRLIIPQYNGTVKVNGAVLHSNTLAYVAGKGIKYYVDQAGGFSDNAKKRNTYIIYANGMTAQLSHNAKPEPGCEIVVPSKIQNKLSLAETLSIGSTAASIAAVVATIANLLK